MNKSNIPHGQMVLHFAPSYMDKPKVWVKVSDENDTEPSLFIDNSACVRFAIDNTYKPSITERWLISDRFYNEKISCGQFIPVSDLNEASRVCEEKGWPYYEADF